ncbi:cuticle protein 10.9-like [Tropilaelaps mercedesae]|uniref:Cuticle protein 10.9-like n=1 Tax=Tropilaelaps mercedesae TaxID=418985 RepID=A0A1V9XJH3_9ACAR|nr:cuticle protein 10.9-like [Tropilaelaps mercedesae]
MEITVAEFTMVAHYQVYLSRTHFPIARKTPREVNFADELSRTVKHAMYTADELSYRAQIITNELGTASKSPANVFLQSHAPTDEQAAYATGGKVGGLVGNIGGGGSYRGGRPLAGIGVHESTGNIEDRVFIVKESSRGSLRSAQEDRYRLR